MRSLAYIAVAALAAACGSSHKNNPTCDASAQTGCSAGQVCEPVQGGSPACFSPVLLRGTVSDASVSPPTLLNGARVVALDANRAPLSSVATSANDGTSDGHYELQVRAERDSTGKPIQAFVTLRADDQGYAPFPGGIRPSLPIDLSTAAVVGTSWVVSGTLTNLELLKAANASSATAYIHGAVVGGPIASGVLVVAVPHVSGTGASGTGVSAIADGGGDYVVYNLAPGTQYDVSAYVKGANYTPVTTAALAAGDNAVAAIDLAAGSGATVSGNFSLNNSPNPSFQVTLVVGATYDAILDRGDSVPGLTVNAGANGYALDGVPDGTYRVLAAFGLDGDVRSISGTGNTSSPAVVVSGGAVTAAPANFKIIPAVNLTHIDGTAVSATPVTLTTSTPTFTWVTGSVDASSKTYRVEVFDAYGNSMTSRDQSAVAGTNTFTYGSSPDLPLQHGMTYQLRVLAIAQPMVVPVTFTIDSYTEDLAGVFIYP